MKCDVVKPKLADIAENMGKWDLGLPVAFGSEYITVSTSKDGARDPIPSYAPACVMSSVPTTLQNKI